MRASIVGVYFADDTPARIRHGEALARTTHTDPRAVESALLAAELASILSRTEPDGASVRSVAGRIGLVNEALAVVHDTELREACDRAIAHVEREPTGTPREAGERLGNTGFVLHTAPLALWCFLRHGDHPVEAITAAIAAGGDTDTTAAIVGAWVGALHGASAEALPPRLVSGLARGPFGERHLRALAAHLAHGTRRAGRPAGPSKAAPGFSWPLAMARNIALYPLVVAHALLGAVGLWGWSTKLMKEPARPITPP